MKGRFDIFRKRAGESDPYRQEFEVELIPGMTVLEVFHAIQAEHDPSFAYRYSCRGAICGSCAVRINGTAALACKTQALPLAEQGTVRIDPLGNLPTIKDLVADFDIFWEAYDSVRPYLERAEETHDDVMFWADKLDAKQLDQLSRAVDCIKCASCFSDCPKRAEDENFIGPQASVQLFKFYIDPRDDLHSMRRDAASSPGGVVDCDSHANCVKVCPKDVRPLRAINFVKKELSATQE
ncbi:MAG TPA: succinate dehydrogenase/fumarate reductase iron-sulfur subunit [bacterium]|nr:succinate dehydrogenase/fumarate reductase iron-sulfur subunit [bacterium]